MEDLTVKVKTEPKEEKDLPAPVQPPAGNGVAIDSFPFRRRLEDALELSTSAEEPASKRSKTDGVKQELKEEAEVPAEAEEDGRDSVSVDSEGHELFKLGEERPTQLSPGF